MEIFELNRVTDAYGLPYELQLWTSTEVHEREVMADSDQTHSR